MANPLDGVMSDDMLGFMNSDEFGESGQYHPDGDSSNSRTIAVSIDRVPPAPMDVSNAPFFRITARNHATLGITAQELDTGMDTISLPRRYGDSTLTVYRIVLLEKHDSAALTLQVR